MVSGSGSKTADSGADWGLQAKKDKLIPRIQVSFGNFYIVLWYLVNAVWEKKGIQIRMGEIKLFAEDMLITVEIPNEPTKNPYKNHEANLERP